MVLNRDSTCTDNLYTDTRYNDKIRYNDNLTVTKPSLKRKQLVTSYATILYLIQSSLFIPTLDTKKENYKIRYNDNLNITKPSFKR